MRIQIRWNMSDKWRRAEAVATGTLPQQIRETAFDLADLTPEQRATLLAQRQLTNGLLLNANVYGGHGSVYFDAEPTIAELLAVVAAQDAHEAAQNAARKARDEREWTISKLGRAAEGEILALERAGDIAALKAFDNALTLPDGEVVYSMQITDAKAKSLRSLRRAELDAQKAAWIAANGSAHLRRAHATGYDCQRTYVKERAEAEMPGWTVDFDDAAQWKTRSMPGMMALDLVDQAAAAGHEATVVWLTRGVEEVDEYEEFEEVEAVVITNYLDKYTLLRIP